MNLRDTTSAATYKTWDVWLQVDLVLKQNLSMNEEFRAAPAHRIFKSWQRKSILFARNYVALRQRARLPSL